MDNIGYTERTNKVQSRKGQRSVKYKLSPVKKERVWKDKRMTKAKNRSQSSKNEYLSGWTGQKNDKTKKIRKFRGYWHWGCYGDAFPCMGCALGAPIKGNHLPPSEDAIQCPTCKGWVYRLSEDTLEVFGCECVNTSPDSDED